MTTEINPYQPPEASLKLPPRPVLSYLAGLVCGLVGLVFSLYTVVGAFAMVTRHLEGQLLTLPTGNLVLIGLLLVSSLVVACSFLAAAVLFLKRHGGLARLALTPPLVLVGLWTMAGILFWR